MQSFSTALVAACCRRVAIERMKTRWLRSEFMRMRSPSSAPPVRRRVGIDRDHRDAHLRESVQEAVAAIRRRRDDLPAPPVPVMPTHRRLAAGQLPMLAQARELGFVVACRLRSPTALCRWRFRRRVDPPSRGVGFVSTGGSDPPYGVAGLGARATTSSIISTRPMLHAVVGVVDALDAVGLQLGDFLGRDRAAAAAEHADVRGAAFSQHVDHVLEVLDVAALVRRQRDARRRLPAARRGRRPRPSGCGPDGRLRRPATGSGGA